MSVIFVAVSRTHRPEGLILKTKTLLTLVILTLVCLQVAVAQAVRVIAVDETDESPLASRAEIWVRGHGSWWIQQAMAELGDWGVGTLSIRRIGTRDTLWVYPDGRNGKDIPIPFLVTGNMCRNGCPGDAIVITFTDGAVQVAGNAVTKRSYPRRLSDSELAASPVDYSIFSEAVVDEKPERQSCPALEYPRMMQQARIEGNVLLQFVVKTDGRVQAYTIEVMNSTHRAFDGPARAMIQKCLFRPGRVGGTAVRVLMQMPVVFDLGGDTPEARPLLRSRGAWVVLPDR